MSVKAVLFASDELGTTNRLYRRGLGRQRGELTDVPRCKASADAVISLHVSYCLATFSRRGFLRHSVFPVGIGSKTPRIHYLSNETMDIYQLLHRQIALLPPKTFTQSIAGRITWLMQRSQGTHSPATDSFLQNHLQIRRVYNRIVVTMNNHTDGIQLRYTVKGHPEKSSSWATVLLGGEKLQLYLSRITSLFMFQLIM